MAFANPNLFPADASTFEGGTHSWNQPNNATLGVDSSVYLSGTRSLRVTVGAAGNWDVLTPYVQDIVPGDEYVSRCPIRINTASAGKSLRLRMLFYAPTGGNIGFVDNDVTIAASSSGWVLANYPVASMIAPPGATKVRFNLYGFGFAAGETVNVDDVYLGKVKRATGELLDYATASAESGAVGWAATNATLARWAGVLQAGAGYSVLGYTSTAAGNMQVRTSARYPVTAGNTYLLYAASMASASLPGSVGVEWFNSSGTSLGTDTETVQYPTGATLFAHSATAPAGAATVAVISTANASAAGQTVYLDAVSLAPPPVVPGNLLTYDEYSTEGSLPAWSASGVSIERSYFTSTITDGWYALKITPEAPGIVAATLDRLVPVTAGKTYKVGATVFRHNSDTAQPATAAARVLVDWYDSNGNLVQADSPDQFYPRDESAEWYAQIVTETRECPPTATRARIGFQLDSRSPLVDHWRADNILLAESEAEYELSTDNTRGSISLVVNSVPDGATAVTIMRVDEDGQKVPLRGYGVSYENAPYTPGPILVEDYEVPLGTRVWYSVEWSGSTFRLFTKSVNAPVLADGDYVWFKSPGIPALNTQVQMEAPLSWSREARSASYSIIGRKNAISRSDVRAGRTSSITVLIWDQASNALFDSLLDSGLVALIQAMPGYGISGNLYVDIGGATCDPLSPDAREDGWRWTLEIAERDRPAGGLQGSAGKTWADIADGFTSWDELFTAYDTWTDVLTKD